jgi:hypothetical protein
MASNTANQNPRYKVGRNSGAGPGGISEVVPSRREAERGLQPIHLDEGATWTSPVMIGLAVAALVGLGVTGYLAQRQRERRTFRGRLEHLVGRR